MHSFHDPVLAQMAAIASRYDVQMKAVPQSTGIGAPGTAPAPGSLARSGVSTQPGAAASIPFPRAATLATMKDKTETVTFGSTAKWTLQTNAFLECLILDVNLLSTKTNSATTVLKADAPWNLISRLQLTDPAGEAIISPISGYHLYLLNKYLIDVECSFDPKADPHYTFKSASTFGGSVSLRLVIPIEHRRRNALGALNNSAANQRYRLTIQGVNSATTVYSTKPTTPVASFKVQVTQQYWTTPPSQIKTKTGTVSTSKTPPGLGTVSFVRYERHNDVSGGGTPTFQLTNVGDYISQLIFVLRDTTSTARDIYTPTTTTPSATAANWPVTFAWWVNDFQVHALTAYGPAGRSSARGIGGVWPREMARFYDYKKSYESATGLDNGVYTFTQMVGLMTQVGNGWTSNQYLPTDATTKLQVRGATFGAHSKYFEVLVRIIRPVSGKALFS